MTILVLGPTGGQGGAVVAALLERGVPVRGLVRDPARPSAHTLTQRGVEVVQGSWYDVDSLAAAMTGTAGVFALTTPFESGPAAEVQQGRAILEAAGRAQVPHLVFSSVASADQRSGVPHFDSKARVEAELPGSGVPYTILGPTYFFDNMMGDAVSVRQGILRLPIPSDRPLQQTARDDLGAFAAEVLLNPDSYKGQRIELASDRPTPAEMAADLSEALGRPVHHEQTPLAAITNPDMHAMWDFFDGPGYQVDIPALHEAHPEISWTSFADWTRQTFLR